MGFHNLVNTVLFSEAANDFRRNKGVYTKAPKGSPEYIKYWEEQERRCIMGYRVGDLWIPGKFYFYLNFTQMWRIPDNVLLQMRKNGNSDIRNARKIKDFPKFTEIDYEWWNFKHIAWYGGEFMGIKSPGARHVSALKTRGAGWSYKEAAEGVWNFVFERGQKSYYFASTEEYLTKDGILSKVKEGLDFINEHVPRWKQNRMKKDTMMHFKASYLTRDSTEKGSGSEIFGITVTNPNKVRGKRGIKVTFEEAGSFKDLKRAVAISVGNIKDGGATVGQISVFGTGGEEGPSIEGLQDIHENPAGYDMLIFPNIWEPELEMTNCGYFVPCYRANILFMDEDGNVDIAGAIADDEAERKKKELLPDPKEKDMRIAEYPRTPSEALQRVRKNIFDVALVNARIKYMRAHRSTIQAFLRHGYMVREEGKAVFRVDADAKPIEVYPHKAGDDLTGCVTVYEQPFTNKNGEVPEGIYFITVDPCYKEETKETTSLFSVRVWKNYNIYDPKNEGLPVAWYRGRPADFNHVYRTIFDLADYYNCKIQSEIAGGGQGIIDYAKRPDVKKLDKLEYELEFTSGAKDTTTITKSTTRFMNLPDEKKRLGMTYLAVWHIQARAGSDEGEVIRNIDRYMDIVGLMEMSKYDPDPKKNFDTLSSDLLAMFMLKDYVVRMELDMLSDEKKDDFFNRGLYGGSGSDDSLVGFAGEDEVYGSESIALY